MPVQVFTEEPKKFFSAFTKGSCFVEVRKGKAIRFLLCQQGKDQAEQWVTPARRVPSGENVRQAIRNKVAELVGCEPKELSIRRVRKVYVVTPLESFEHLVFRIRLPYLPAIQGTRHQAYVWDTPRKALKKKLAPELPFCVERVYKLS